MDQGISEGVVTPARRVRHDMRDTLTVMAFSAAASSGVAALLALVVRLGN
jgi:hypothetical protein